MNVIRYFLDQDQDGHWYKVEERRRKEWMAWNELDQNDEKAWDNPTFSHRLRGGPEMVSFENPMEAE